MMKKFVESVYEIKRRLRGERERERKKEKGKIRAEGRTEG